MGLVGDIDTIPCVIQYFQPSITTIETSYSSYDTLSFTDVSSQFSTSIFDRADFPILFIDNFIICLIFVFVINQLSKLVYKGGLFRF